MQPEMSIGNSKVVAVLDRYLSNPPKRPKAKKGVTKFAYPPPFRHLRASLFNQPTFIGSDHKKAQKIALLIMRSL
jgi:hypothetical protein